MKRPQVKQILLFAAAVFFLCPGTAHAYLDPGTGSLLVSALIGLAATAFFMVKSMYYRAASLVYRLRGVSAPRHGKDSIMFYSEGKQYWNTFRPVLESLDRAGEAAVYMTSGKDDPGLEHHFKHVSARYIGEGNRAFAAMGMLEAGVCVMTTPGLDVLQIRRSRLVNHYAHLVHAPTDISFYKLFSFDYYDSVLCSGAHQMKSLRELEHLRGTTPKQLLETGCPYMDVLADELERLNLENQQQGKIKEERRDGQVKVLLAPTWGANGLLRRFGASLLQPMLEAGFEVTVRPHPQSRISEPELLEDLAARFATSPNLKWDANVSPMPAMLDSDVLLSDFSGIVFDYAFILERPVITVPIKPETRGFEAGDIPWEAWELTLLPKLGALLEQDKLGELPKIIDALPGPAEFTEYIRALRAESLFNYRHSGEAAAKSLMAIRDEIKLAEREA